MAATDYGGRVAQLFHMSDDVWARHANSWSVWTRVASFPLLLVAIWSHVWIGWTWAIAATLAVAIWLWLNPRIFPPPATTDTWAAKVTFGERVWLNRKAIPIPRHHETIAHILSAVSAIGFVVGLYGAVETAIWPAILGTVLVYAGKLWFCDRMVWLYEDMKDRDPTYRSWLR